MPDSLVNLRLKAFPFRYMRVELYLVTKCSVFSDVFWTQLDRVTGLTSVSSTFVSLDFLKGQEWV